MKNTELDKIKEFPITAFLDSLGLAPAKHTGGKYYYYSPFRSEKTASFCVYESTNTWFDFGDDPNEKGGDIIDLVKRVTGVGHKEAVEMLSQVVQNPALIGIDGKPKPVILEEREYKQTLQLIRVENLTHGYLWNYLSNDRKINIQMIQKNPETLNNLKEIYYKAEGKNKEYYSIGFKNSAGGFELRSKNFKSFIGGKKTISFIKGTRPGCAVFEGFIDYLSALTYYQCASLGYDVVILNSTRLIRQAMPILKAQPNLHLFLDNNSTGLKTADYIIAECKNIEIDGQPQVITKHNDIYKGYEDFNALLTGTKPNKPLPGVTRDTVSEQSQKSRWWLWVAYKEVQYTKDGRPFKSFPFYSYNNHESGLKSLHFLFERLKPEIEYFRLCERTTGRDFKILDEGPVR